MLQVEWAGQSKKVRDSSLKDEDEYYCLSSYFFVYRGIKV